MKTAFFPKRSSDLRQKAKKSGLNTLPSGCRNTHSRMLELERDVDWANETLRFCIATLQGKIEVSKVKARISTCLVLKRRLASKGFWWQVKILDHWIHRAQRGEFDAF